VLKHAPRVLAETLKPSVMALKRVKDKSIDSAVVRQTLKQFVTDTFIKESTRKTLGDCDSFFEKGIIDSTGVLELVLFLEETFGFRVEDEEIVPDNLDSIKQLVDYVESKHQKPDPKTGTAV